MENIQLEGGINKSRFGRKMGKVSELLARWKNREGYIFSEADIRFYGAINFRNAPDIVNTSWYTSTLLATKGEAVKVILPYEVGSRELIEVAEIALGLFNHSEKVEGYEGINLDIDRRWGKLEGNGVYTLQREGLLLDQCLTEKQAMEHELILTKLGHPDYVEKSFWMFKGEKNQSIGYVQKLIRNTFYLGEYERGYSAMMGQYLAEVSDKGVLNMGKVNTLIGGAGSYTGDELYDYERFVFYSVEDAKSDAEGIISENPEVCAACNIKNIFKEKRLTGIEKILTSGF